jgi:flagellar biogenesis protein FliO
MPATARFIGLVFVLLVPGTALAQAANAPASQSGDDEFDSRPPLITATTGPVRIAPPVTVAEKAVNAAGGGNRSAGSILPARRELPISLSPPGNSEGGDYGKRPSSMPSMATVLGGLATVLGVFLIVAWLMRRTAPQRFTRLPNEAFEVLGRAPLLGRQNVHLLRCGSKLLLVSITPAGTETLTEITDPQEVDRLAGLCHQAGPGSSTAAFRQIFEQLAPRRAGRAAFSQDRYGDDEFSEVEPRDAMDWEYHHA